MVLNTISKEKAIFVFRSVAAWELKMQTERWFLSDVYSEEDKQCAQRE